MLPVNPEKHKEVIWWNEVSKCNEQQVEDEGTEINKMIIRAVVVIVTVQALEGGFPQASVSTFNFHICCFISYKRKSFQIFQDPLATSDRGGGWITKTYRYVSRKSLSEKR